MISIGRNCRDDASSVEMKTILRGGGADQKSSSSESKLQNWASGSIHSSCSEYDIKGNNLNKSVTDAETTPKFAPVSNSNGLTIPNLTELQNKIRDQSFRLYSGSRLTSSVSQELLTPAEALGQYLQEQADIYRSSVDGILETTASEETPASTNHSDGSDSDVQNSVSDASELSCSEYDFAKRNFFNSGLRNLETTQKFAPNADSKGLTISNLARLQSQIKTQNVGLHSGSRLTSSVSLELLTPAVALAQYLQERADLFRSTGNGIPETAASIAPNTHAELLSDEEGETKNQELPLDCTIAVTARDNVCQSECSSLFSIEQ